MQKQLLLSLLVFLPCLLFAQRQYFDATITTNNGQKVEGKIAVENWFKTPRSIEFKTEKDASTIYQISELSSFVVTRADGQKLIFDRKVVELEVSPNKLGELEGEATLHYQRDTAWLQLVYQGTWKLYSVAQNGKTHFLVQTKDEQPVELVLKSWRRQNDKEYLIQHVNMYRKQLVDLATGCPAAQKKVLSSDWGPKSGEELQEKDLVKFFKIVDDCKASKTTYELSAEKSKITGQVLLGTHLSSYNFNPAANREINGLLGYQIGFGASFFLRKSNKRTAFYNELIFYHDLKKSDTHITYGTQNFISIIEYRSSQIGVSNMMSFKISKLTIAPAIKIGIVHRLGVSWDITERTGYTNTIDNAPVYDKHHYKRFYEFGPTIGLCGQYNRIGLDIRLANMYSTGYFGLSKKPSSKVIAFNLTYQIF
jgi:hypothetical protein